MHNANPSPLVIGQLLDVPPLDEPRDVAHHLRQLLLESGAPLSDPLIDEHVTRVCLCHLLKCLHRPLVEVEFSEAPNAELGE